MPRDEVNCGQEGSSVFREKSGSLPIHREVRGWGRSLLCTLRNLFIITLLLGWPQSSFLFFHNTGKNPENKTLPYEVHDCCCCSVTKSCTTLCDLMDCSPPGFPTLHHLTELAQVHVHGVSDAIKPSHLLSPPSPLALNLSQHQGLFQ